MVEKIKGDDENLNDLELIMFFKVVDGLIGRNSNVYFAANIALNVLAMKLGNPLFSDLVPNDADEPPELMLD